VASAQLNDVGSTSEPVEVATSETLITTSTKPQAPERQEKLSSTEEQKELNPPAPSESDTEGTGSAFGPVGVATTNLLSTTSYETPTPSEPLNEPEELGEVTQAEVIEVSGSGAISSDPIISAAATVLAPSVGEGKMLYSLGFESTGWEDEFTGQSAWGDHLARTSNAPHSGAYSLRGNQIKGKIDGITGLPGIASPILDWRGGGRIASRTPDELYFSYWFRHDDYNHRLENDGSGEGKLMYFIDETYGAKAMYLNNQLAANSTLRLRYSNGGYKDNWGRTHWGFAYVNLTNPNVRAGTEGNWIQFEYYINYKEKFIKIWVNGRIMKSSKHGDPAYPMLPADGRIYYDPKLDLRIKGLQFFWTRSTNIDSSTNRVGYAAGWQIDDLEVWNGMPSLAYRNRWAK
jgi:hypothetical protein